MGAGSIAAVLALSGCSDSSAGAAADPIDIAIVGDSFTSGTPLGGEGDANWTRVLDTLLDSTEVPHTVSAESGNGSGYSSPGVRGLTFAQMAATVIDPDTDLVIVFGSVNDAGEPEESYAADVAATLATIRKRVPSATVIVVGPAWVDARIPPEVEQLEEVLRAASLRAEVDFVNPLEKRWFFDPNRSNVVGLISTDGLHPTDAGHRYLAERMADLVNLELRARAADADV
jgi:hypothetical protein